MHSHTAMERKVNKKTEKQRAALLLFLFIGGGDRKSTVFRIFQRMMRCSFGYKAVEIRMDHGTFGVLFCFRTIANVLLGHSSCVFCCVLSFVSIYLYFSTKKMK